MSNGKRVNYGIDFLDGLILIFITLKLCKVIDWSWWWVLSPLWITLILAIFLYTIARLRK